MHVRALGPVSVDGGRLSLAPRDRVVLAALAASAGEMVEPAGLASALWGDEHPASWTKVVAGCVMRLRRILGAEAIETVPGGYRLDPAAVEFDVDRFMRLIGRGHDMLRIGEPDRAAHMFEQALGLWRGRPFAEAEEWGPARLAADRLEELRLETEEGLLAARLQTDDAWQVAADAQLRVAEAPLRERRWALLAQAHYRDGRQADALLTLRQARGVLAAELGLDPNPNLADLEKAILRQDAQLLAGQDYVPPVAECPYFGLVPAGVDDAELFFGRERELRESLDALAERGVLVIAGPSGVGKSSLARAGIAATLRGQGRDVRLLTPGAHPMAALAQVPSSTGRGALVVDQCEEAILLCDDPDDREAFFAALADRAFEGLLVVTLRADRLGDLVAYPEFAGLVASSLMLLGPLTPEGIKAAIEQPARRSGMLLEPGLVDLLVRDVGDEPGALPLLSHALRETWLRREGRMLTVDAYRESGGIQGAVAQSAEELYLRLPDPQRQIVRGLMLRLVEPSSDRNVVRVRVARRTIPDDAPHAAVVERLVDARLLTSDDGALEVSHEALARAWPRLREWLEDDIAGQRILRHLGEEAETWDAMGRPDSELYRGARLSSAQEWRATASPDLTVLEQEFLDASSSRERANLADAQRRLRRERRTVRRLRWLTAMTACLALVAAAAGGVALIQRQRADDGAVEAEARRVAARALVEPQFDRALLLAVQAVHLLDSPETRGNLLTAIQRSPLARSFTRGAETGRILELDLSADGSRAVVIDGLDKAALFDLEARAPITASRALERSFLSAAITPAGDRVAASWVNPDCWVGDCRQVGVAVFDGDSLTGPGTVLGGFRSPIADVAFSPDATLLAAVAPLPWYSDAPNVVVWELARPDTPLLRLHIAEVGSNPILTPERQVFGTVEFSPAGDRLFASGFGPVVAFDLVTGDVVATYDGDGLLAVSPDGDAIVISEGMESVRVVPVDGAAPAVELDGGSGAVLDAAVSPDGTLVATVGNDQTVALWDRWTGERLDLLAGHVGAVHAVAFDDDGDIVTAGSDGAIVRWDVRGDAGLSEQLRAPDESVSPLVMATALAPSGDRMVILREDGAALAAAGDSSSAELGHEASWAAFHPDGSRVATVGWDGSVRLWDAVDGSLLAELPESVVENSGAIAFLEDGRHLVTVNAAGRLRVLDGATLAPLGEMRLGISAVGLRAGAGGVIAVTGQSEDIGSGTEVVFADVLAGTELHRLRIDHWGVRANFSPDGTRWAFGGTDGVVGVVDVASGSLLTPTREPLHGGAVSWVVFSPDASSLVTVGFDGGVTISEASDAMPYARFTLPRRAVASSAVFRDDQTVVFGLTDGSIVALDLDPRSWERHACVVAGRELTAQEWRDAFGDRPYETICSSASGQ